MCVFFSVCLIACFLFFSFPKLSPRNPLLRTELYPHPQLNLHVETLTPSALECDCILT